MSYGYAAVHNGTGVILRVVSCLRQHATLQASNPDEAVVFVSDQISDLTHYVNDKGEVQEKAEIVTTLDKPEIVADGDDTATISGIPPSAEVVWPDGVVTSGDETVEFAVDLPGTYTLRFTAVEYLDKEVTIEAVAAT